MLLFLIHSNSDYILIFSNLPGWQLQKTEKNNTVKSTWTYEVMNWNLTQYFILIMAEFQFSSRIISLKKKFQNYQNLYRAYWVLKKWIKIHFIYCYKFNNSVILDNKPWECPRSDEVDYNGSFSRVTFYIP